MRARAGTGSQLHWNRDENGKENGKHHNTAMHRERENEGESRKGECRDKNKERKMEVVYKQRWTNIEEASILGIIVSL